MTINLTIELSNKSKSVKTDCRTRTVFCEPSVNFLPVSAHFKHFPIKTYQNITRNRSTLNISGFKIISSGART
jgi:hypothetical protein